VIAHRENTRFSINFDQLRRTKTSADLAILATKTNLDIAKPLSGKNAPHQFHSLDRVRPYIDIVSRAPNHFVPTPARPRLECFVHFDVAVGSCTDEHQS